MALQFRPPTDILALYEQQRQNSLNNLNQTINNIGDDAQKRQALNQQYVQRKLEQKNAAAKNFNDLLATDPKLVDTPYGKRLAQEAGIDLGGYQPPTLSTGTVQSPTTPTAPPTNEMIPMDANNTPIGGPQQGPPLPGVGLGMAAQQRPVSGMGAPSPVIDHWNSMQGGGQPTAPTSPTTSQINPLPEAPSQQDIMGLMGRGKLGKAAVSDYKTGVDTMKSIEGMGNKRIPFEDVMTTFQAANENSIGEKLISDAKAAGLNYVPENKLNLAMRGLGVKNAGMRGGAIDLMADTKSMLGRDSLNKEARTTLNPLFQSGEGRNQMTILNRIGRAEPLIDQMMTQKGGGDKRQMRELASSLDRIIRGGGQSAQSQIDDLMPDTARGKFAHWQEWFSNDPTGTEQKAFISRYADTIKREKTAVQSQVKSMAEKNAPTLRVLRDRYPEDYKAQLDSVMNNPQLVGEGVGGLSPEKQARLEELRRKKAEGTLK